MGVKDPESIADFTFWDVTITPFYGAIQDKNQDSYMQLKLVITPYIIVTRKCVNATLADMMHNDNPECLNRLIDGGEGFQGQSSVILSALTSCYECYPDMLTPETAVPLHTVPQIPRLAWPHVFEGIFSISLRNKKLHNDDPERIKWVYEQGLRKARVFNISRVTCALTHDVIKNIIPAIASTNTIITSPCCNEMMYISNRGVYTLALEHEKMDHCPVCGKLATDFNNDHEWQLEELVNKLKEQPEVGPVEKPTLVTEQRKLDYQGQPQWNGQTMPNSENKMKDVVDDKEEMAITDPGLPFRLILNISF
ncbi:hypothetical protein HOY80DRAFT_1016377 [Tuber brumale]|nr:hypothetical protein HOY80DRAFT_1016377 [Tuber brumale]